jgi:hypothetical protein
MRLAAIAVGAILALPEPPASLTVRLADGRSTFAVGEVIQLDLEFNGSPDPDLYFSTESSDRSGRMGTEGYSVSPQDGTADPLADYFESGAGTIGGGLRSWHTLDGTPFHLRVRLNEWIRFSRPGHYTLRVRSRRLHRYSNDRQTFELQSDAVELDIVAASAEWAAGELARARRLIDTGRRDQMQDGVVILRHLGTREATLELLDRYDRLYDGFQFQTFTGLIASPFRSEIVSAMEARIDRGDPLSAGFVNDAAMLRALVEIPIGTGTAQERMAALPRLRADYGARWAAATLRGAPTVERFRGVLMALAQSSSGDTSLALGGALAAHPSIATEAFASLDRVSQRTLVQYRWSAIRDAAWTRAALEKVYRAWKGDYRFSDVGDYALTHLTELDPAFGRSLALEEIRTGAHGLTCDVLSSVDAPADPDAALQERLARARGDDRVVTLCLMARYGSQKLTPAVRGALGSGADCATEGAAVAYLLQHHPEDALPRLQPDFDRSRGCVTVPWRELARYYWDDRIETAALAHIGLPDVDRAASAIQILGEKGSAAVKAPLMDRLSQWAEVWRGRAADLDRMRGRPVDSPGRLENALVNALVQNARFALTPEDVLQIRASCVTESCRSILSARVKR